MIEWIGLPAIVIAFVSFLGAFVLVLATPSGEPRRPRIAKVLLSVILFIYVMASVSLFVSEFDLEQGLGESGEAIVNSLEDHIETLFPLLAVGAVFAAYSAQQMEDVRRAQGALARSHSLMMDIVDSTPAGVLFIGDTGRIVVANESAKRALGLAEDAETAEIRGGTWVAEGAPDDRPGDLTGLLGNEPYDGRALLVRWPDGRWIELMAAGRPLLDAKGALGGVVVSFERPVIHRAD